MTNKDLISQYVDTGMGIPRYQFDKLSNNDKKTYLRKMVIRIESDAIHKRIDNLDYYYGELPESTQIKIVSNNGNFLSYVSRTPSRAVQLAAVNNDATAIRGILSLGLPLTEEVQLVAVNKDASLIQYIENPSEQVQLAAVNNDGLCLEEIQDPSEAVQLAAIKNNGGALQHIDNPTEAVQMLAVQQNGYSIQIIENPSEAVQLAAVKRHGDAIRYIDNPTESVQFELLKHNPKLLVYARPQNENIQMALVRKAAELHDYMYVSYLRKPTNDVLMLLNQLNNKIMNINI